jgi:hypothetical protein
MRRQIPRPKDLVPRRHVFNQMIRNEHGEAEHDEEYEYAANQAHDGSQGNPVERRRTGRRYAGLPQT